jgi:Trypsin-co-occurring domain 2
VTVSAELEPLALSAALDGLRDELETAWADSQGKSIRFRVKDVTLTLQAVARREKEAGGKVRWWVIEGGAGGRAASETTQTLVLTLTPGTYNEDGSPEPLDVAGVQQEPGR